MRELLAITAGLALCGILQPHDKEVKPAVLFSEITVCKQKKKTDKELALETIAKSKYPKTLKAIAIVESRIDPKSIGDHGDSYGLFHIQKKYWGPVPKSIEGQVDKAEKILDELIEKHGYYDALARWNGKGKASIRHRNRVLLAMKGE